MRAYKWTFGFYLEEFTAYTRSGKCIARCTHWWWPFLDTFGSPVSTGNDCYLLEPAGTRELALWTTQLCPNKRCIISISWMLVRKKDAREYHCIQRFIPIFLWWNYVDRLGCENGWVGSAEDFPMPSPAPKIYLFTTFSVILYSNYFRPSQDCAKVIGGIYLKNSCDLFKEKCDLTLSNKCKLAHSKLNQSFIWLLCD